MRMNLVSDPVYGRMDVSVFFFKTAGKEFTLPGAIPGHSGLPPLAARLQCTHMTTE